LATWQGPVTNEPSWIFMGCISAGQAASRWLLDLTVSCNKKNAPPDPKSCSVASTYVRYGSTAGYGSRRLHVRRGAAPRRRPSRCAGESSRCFTQRGDDDRPPCSGQDDQGFAAASPHPIVVGQHGGSTCPDMPAGRRIVSHRHSPHSLLSSSPFHLDRMVCPMCELVYHGDQGKPAK
jgi:hypothetical protein